MEKAAITGYIVSGVLINLDQPEGTQLLKDTTPSIAWMRHITPAGTNPRTYHRPSPGGEKRGKRKRATIFLESTRAHRQTIAHCNYFKGNVGEACERRGVACIWAFPSAQIPS